MSRERELSGIAVVLLDGNKVNDLLFDVTGRETCKLDMNQALILTLDGMAVVNTEGVGEVEDITGWVDIWANEFNPINVPMKRLIEECSTVETKDLARFVRVFGDRLDRNVSIWTYNTTHHMKVNA